MATISSLGLSGLPLSDLLADLRKVEEAPLSLLKNRKTIFEAKVSAYGMIKSSLSSVQTSLKTLSESATFSALKTTSSNTASFTATAAKDGTAVPGTYAVQVKNLATTQSLATAGVDDSAASIGTGGKITITLGNNDSVEIDLDGGTSLEAVRTAINKAGKGFSATLVNNGDTTKGHQLVISTTATGTASRITGIEVTGNDGNLQNILGYQEGAYQSNPPLDGEEALPSPLDADGKLTVVTQTAAAKDAKLTISGIEITSGSNTVKDAVEGLTLNLLSAPTDDSTATLKVEENTAVAKSAVEAFVAAYNSLQTTLTKLTSFDTAENSRSVLTGDRVPRTVQSQLRAELSAGSGSEGFTMLSQLGITTNVDTGALEIDSGKLTKALEENKGDVAKLFTGEKGLAKRLDSAITRMLDKDGLISNVTEGAEASIEKLDDQYRSSQTRIDETMARYQTQFVQLEIMMSQMNGISSYLTTQLDMLESLAKGNKK